MKDMISIIIPIYKVEEYLDRCVRSVVNQTYKKIEIILVDDGSPDNCPQLCDEWAIRDNRIIVIHKENGGLSSARNAGIKEARGEYILFVDSDDYIDQNTCEKLIKYAEGVDLVVGEATIYEDKKIIHSIHTNLEENCIYTGTECAMKEIMAGEWYAPACYNMYRRRFILDNALLFTEGILHEDVDYLPRLFLAAKTVKYIKYEFYKYIIRESSICGSKSEKNLNDLFEIYARWAKLNDTILDKKVKKLFSGALAKYFMATCREYKVKENKYPEGISGKYLIYNALNIKELLKAVFFNIARSKYVTI